MLDNCEIYGVSFFDVLTILIGWLFYLANFAAFKTLAKLGQILTSYLLESVST
jgi:hypothetical protein